MAPLPSKGPTLTFFLLSILLTLALDGPYGVLASGHYRREQLNGLHAVRDNHARRSSLLRERQTSLEEDMNTIYERRVSTIINGLASTNTIASWLSTLGPDGKWPDSEVDLTTGCEARRASWPAQTHWRRIVVMAGAWHGARNAPQWVNNTQLRNATSLAMSYWINRDIGEDIACLDHGGKEACPCENPRNTLWNTNWFSNIILIPEHVAHACLLLRPSLTPIEASFCQNVTTRTWGVFERGINGVSQITGANTLDIAKISVDAGLLTGNADILADAYRRIHEEMKIVDELREDGIRADGSFAQHKGVLYNGNYGKDYFNAVIDLEIASGNTQFQAGQDSKKAFETLFKGNKWMIFYNTVTKVLHWDFSVIGRMISFPVIDNQASGNLKTNLTSILQLGNLWGSDVLKGFASQLDKEHQTANAGNLVGNKMFFTTDYMVHRTPGYISTLKMYSSRTTNTECLNFQNLKGFHLADGTLYTYQKGDEYEDIFASWDWDLIPGTTVDYQNTPLACADTTKPGIEPFVGGLSDGHSGVSAMRYTNPINGALKWQKAWFILDTGVYHVMVNILSSTSGAPVYSVLDQKRRSGETKIDGQPVADAPFTRSNPKSIWHDNIGYTFPHKSNSSATLNLRTGPVTGDWSTIGTSTRPATTVDLWASWLEHKDINEPVEYTIWPGRQYHDFKRQSHQSPVRTLQNTKDLSAIVDTKTNRVMAVFWNQAGGSLVYDMGKFASLKISADNGLILTLSLEDGKIIASDPSQTLASATVTFEYGLRGNLPKFWRGGRKKTVKLTFPTGGIAGSETLVVNTKNVSAILNTNDNPIMSVFWNQEGGSLTYDQGKLASLTISCNSVVIFTVSLEDGSILASDPSQTLASAKLTLEFGLKGKVPKFWEGGRTKVVELTFPQGGLAGSEVKASLQ